MELYFCDLYSCEFSAKEW